MKYSLAWRPAIRILPALFLLVAAIQLPADVVKAQAQLHRVQPLIIVRFNQPKVWFEKQLYNAVSQAVAAKPTVMFDVISVAATGPDGQPTAQQSRQAEDGLNRVVRVMNDMGVPASRIAVSRQTSAAAESGEVHVFVR